MKVQRAGAGQIPGFRIATITRAATRGMNVERDIVTLMGRSEEAARALYTSLIQATVTLKGVKGCERLTVIGNLVTAHRHL